LPVSSLLTGTNLVGFRPSALVGKLWPRPILVVHATHDQVVPFEHGRRLFDAASYPKQPLWVPLNDQNDVLRDSDTADIVREFFDSARSVSAI
jgi:fermentation-respiration switch protein FrsA (DUF1100 family)